MYRAMYMPRYLSILCHGGEAPLSSRGHGRTYIETTQTVIEPVIPKNLGSIERAIRLLLAALLMLWVWQGDGSSAAEAAAVLAACALVWNAIFGSCYLWRWLGLNSTSDEGSQPTASSQIQGGESGNAHRS